MPDKLKSGRVNEITGAFVLVVAAALIAAVVWTGHSQRWFKSRVTLRIALPEGGAAGIREGSEVYFLGTLVGSVSDMVVEPTGRMAAEAGIRRDFFRFVRVDSSAVVKRKFGVAGAGPCRRMAPPSLAPTSFKARWSWRSRKSTRKPCAC
jgi:phospholipid/cholesterol/gamma-HCH transport system substrate-binding protein